MDTILIVDDNPENLKVLGEFIVQQGYQIEFADSGGNALDKIYRNPPDLILLDVYMPDISGFEVCTKLKENPKYEDIPVLFISAYTERENIIKSFWIGGIDFIPKPFEEEVVMARVKTHLDLSKMRRKLEHLVDERTEELKRAKDELLDLNQRLEKAYEELKNLDDAKINFLQIISHEMRTPLNGISGFTHLLRDRLKNSDFENYISHLIVSVDRLEVFSKKALFISELQTNSYTVDKEEIQCTSIINVLRGEFKQKLNYKSLSLNVEVDETIFIRADRELVMSMLSIIMDNAIRYIGNNEMINITIHQIKEGTEILIQDSGPGFSDEQVKCKFQLFRTGSDFVDKNFGLGLATVKLIMDRHNGTVDIGNNIDGGAYVKLVFATV
ncbi:MAG: hybrid sensor histidine kinase/response regulator [Bacteroidales bacterium]|nr:hybrid sensor histidine kinase/response regulator [Bacteroidales bacterium]